LLQPPDGFEDLAPHNLFSFKSYQEALDGEGVEELIGHGVNYRKQVSPSMQSLFPSRELRLFAACVRSPEKLVGNLPRGLELTPVKPGVQVVTSWGFRAVRSRVK